MRITKEYNVESLADELNEEIVSALDSGSPTVEINVMEALNILDVLRETVRREREHQTLNSAITFMELESGGKTNEMEYYEDVAENNLCSDTLSTVYRTALKHNWKVYTNKQLYDVCLSEDLIKDKNKGYHRKDLIALIEEEVAKRRRTYDPEQDYDPNWEEE